MIAFFEKLARRGQDRKQQAATGWRSTVLAIADGQEPDEAGVEKMLAECGKTPQDLEEAVAMLHKRRAWAKDLEAAQAAKAELAAVRDETQKEVDLHSIAQKRFDEKMAALRERENAANLTIAQADESKRWLMRTGNDAAIQAELDQLNAANREIAAESERIRNQLPHTERAAAVNERKVHDLKADRIDTSDLQTVVDQQRETTEKMRNVLADNDRELRSNEARIATLREKLLEPSMI